MFERGNEQYLIRVINRNQAILFLGAGFSTLAKNQRGENLPTGARFAELLWGFLGYPPPYDPTSSLAELYEALLASGKPVSVISDFLTSNLLSVDAPREYQEIVKVFWSRIYTTNIDNLLEQTYALVVTPRLDIRSFPRDELPDRDVTLDRIQAVHLHGRLPCAPKDATFSISQFARRATPHDHLYDHFVRGFVMSHRINIILDDDIWESLQAVPKGKRSPLVNQAIAAWLVRKNRRGAVEAMNALRKRARPVAGAVEDWVGEDRDRHR